MWTIDFPLVPYAQATYVDLKNKYPDIDIILASNQRQIRYFALPSVTVDNVRAMFTHEDTTFTIIPPSDYSKRYQAAHTITTSLSLGYSVTMNDQVFSDMTLVINGHKMYVHRHILASVSTYFKNLFTRMKESTQSVIELKEINYTHFRKYLDIIYGRGLSVYDSDCLVVLDLSVRLLTAGIDYEDILPKLVQPKGDNVEIFVRLVTQLYGSHIPEAIRELIDDFSLEDHFD